MSPGSKNIVGTIKRFHSFRYYLILEGMITGIFAGLLVIFFRLLLERGDELREGILSLAQGHTWLKPLWFIILLAAALLVAALLKWEPYISGSGIPQLEGEMTGKLDQKWWRVIIAKCIGSCLAIGSGLSLGREGPSIQLGAMVGKGLSRLTNRIKTEERLLLTCGAGAGLSAAFNAPLAGVLFALEEVHKNFSPEVLLSTMASSVAADFVSRNVFGLKPVFSFYIKDMMPIGQYGHAVALGIILGFFGVFYNYSVDISQKLYQKIPWQTLWLVIPFLCAGVLAFTCPKVLGGGHELVMEVSGNQFALGALITVLVIKFIFSMVSFGSGSPGGIFLPLLVMGAMVGSIYYKTAGLFLPVPEWMNANFVILGMAGYFSAIVRAPITGIVLISEMTGSLNHLLTLAIVSLFAYIVPDLLKSRPIYEQLLIRMLARLKPSQQKEQPGEKLLLDSIIRHGAPAVGKTVSEIVWPNASLLVSIMRENKEMVPKGDTVLKAGDRIVLLCDESIAPVAHRTLAHQCESMNRSFTR